jgi:hypothetical protein
MSRTLNARIRRLTDQLGPPARPIQLVTYVTAYEQPDGTLRDEDGQLIVDGPPIAGLNIRVSYIEVVVPAARGDGPSCEAAS